MVSLVNGQVTPTGLAHLSIVARGRRQRCLLTIE
jgi:hypothetical protein